MYRGRFAPSPSGPLHFGSLVAAVGSYLDAHAHQGEWRVRIEDVDGPRCVPGAAEDILDTLEAFGFQWHGPVLRQSRRRFAYAEALERLRDAGWVYGCSCSRRDIAASAVRESVDGGFAYPGTCRTRSSWIRSPRAWRMRTDNRAVTFDDRLLGRVSQNLESDVGDFVLLRADGFYAYQLAVVVDDAFEGITHVVRGADLVDSTPRQIWLQECLGLPRPEYAHLPVAVTEAGEKLSKQTRAPALDRHGAASELVAALDFLGQSPPRDLAAASVRDVWEWAFAAWSFGAVPRHRAIVTS